MDLEKMNEYTFSVKIVGEKTKKSYEGNFTVRCNLTYQEEIEMGLLIDRYNGGSRTVPDGIFRMNRALAELDVRIMIDPRTNNQKAPSWWRDSNGGRTLLDKNVVLEVFLKALDGEAEFDKRVKEAADEAEASVEKQAKKNKAKETKEAAE